MSVDQAKEILGGIFSQAQEKVKALWTQKWFRVASAVTLGVGALYYSSVIYARVYYNSQPFNFLLRQSCLEKGENVNFSNKNCWAICTGTTIGGIGYDTAYCLAKSGLNVILANRNAVKSKAAEDLLREQLSEFEGAGQLKTILLDLSKPSSVNEFCDNVTAFINDGTGSKSLVVICNNAALAGLNPEYLTLTANDGKEYEIEKQWVTNYFMAVLMIEKLFPLIQEGSKELNFGRIVQVSSMAHNDMLPGSMDKVESFMKDRTQKWSETDYVTGNRVTGYGETKAAGIIYVGNFAQRQDLGCIKVCAPHPGFGQSSLLSNSNHSMSAMTASIASLLMSPAQVPTSMACRTQVHCCLAMNEEKSVKSGSYHYDCHYQLTGRHNSNAREVIDAKIESGEFYKQTLDFVKLFDQSLKE